MKHPKYLKPLAAPPNQEWTSLRVHWFPLLLACLLGVPGPVLAAPGDITTVGGGVGQGSALSIGQAPAGVVVSGSFVYVADSFNHVVRRIDTRTGTQIVVAGNGTWGFRGDGGPATDAQLSYPAGVAVDPAGNLFIADLDNQRIRKVDTAGTITTVAGNGGRGFSGDGGPATSAQLFYPSGLAVDLTGNLIMADSFNQRVRKVDTAGTITTIAGTGSRGFSGDNGPATDAQLSTPSGVAVGPSGDLLIADVGNQRIRKVDTAGTITTVAGNGTAGFSGDGGPATSAQLSAPSGVTAEASGSLFIADANNQRIRTVDPAGTITTVAGNGTAGFSGDGGPATSAQLSAPSSVAVDEFGNLFIADTNNRRLRKVDTQDLITTVAGNGTSGFGGDGGPAASANLNFPTGLALDAAGSLIIADSFNQRIRKVDTAATITTVAGNGTSGSHGDGRPATSAQLFIGFIYPSGVVVDTAANLLIVDVESHRIRKVDAAGTITNVAGLGVAGFSGDGGPATVAQLYRPSSVAVDPAGNLFIADVDNHRIRTVDPAGTITTVAGNGTAGFSGDGGPAPDAQLRYPSSVAVDAASNLFIADTGNNRIRRVDTAGTITTVAGTGTEGFGGDAGPATSAQLSVPTGVAVDPAGNLFIADGGNNRIRKVNTTGIITTVSGTGTQTFGGDGGPATGAQLNFPCAVAVDAAGNLFIADAANSRIREVEAFPTATPTSMPTPVSTSTPTLPPSATPTAGGGGGGGCTVTPTHGRGAAWWLLVPVLVLGWVRRRRSGLYP